MRLLFVANTESVQNTEFGKAVGEGSASIMKKWPSILSTLCKFIILATIVVIFLFVIFVIIIVQLGKTASKNKPANIPGSEDTMPGSNICKPVTVDNLTLMALGYIEGKKQLSATADSKNNLFYVIDRPISYQGACALETALRLFQEKTFFIIEMEGSGWKDTQPNNTDYFLLLRKKFPNLNKMKAEVLAVFENSPFEGSFEECDDLAIFATKVLLVWQYGGTSLSTNILFTSRQIYDKNEGMCEVDRDFLFCPGQCSAYVYQLIKTILNVQKYDPATINDKDFLFEKIVDISVKDFCGNLKSSPTGCIGVNRIKSENVCSFLTRGCDFIRMDEWKRRNNYWRNEIIHLCPTIFKHMFPD